VARKLIPLSREKILKRSMEALKGSTGKDLGGDVFNGAITGAENRFRRYKRKGYSLDEKLLQSQINEVCGNKTMTSVFHSNGITLDKVKAGIQEAFEKVRAETTDPTSKDEIARDDIMLTAKSAPCPCGSGLKFKR